MTRRPVFTFVGKLPSANDYIGASRKNPQAAARMKRDTDGEIYWRIVEQNVPRYGRPVKLFITWHEPPSRNGRRRDFDNIVFGKKFILDAMVRAHVMHDDSLEYITEITERVVQEEKGTAYGFEVYIAEEGEEW